MKTGTFFAGLWAGLLTAGAVFAADYSSWAAYRDITVNTTGITSTPVTNIPVLVRFSQAGQPDMFSASPGPAVVQAGGADLRFTQADGTADLPFEVEEWILGAGGSGTVWVLLPNVAANSAAGASFRVYWGKADAQATASSSSTTFSTGNGFQGVWHLGEASGADARDATGNNFHGAPAIGQSPTNPGSLTDPNVITVPQDTLGVIGRGKVFIHNTRTGETPPSNGGAGGYYAMDGTASGSVTTASSALSFAPNQAYTLSAWVRPTNTAGDGAARSGIIMGKGDSLYYIGRRNTGNNWEHGNSHRTGTNGKNVRSIAIGAENIGSWHHVAIVRTDSLTATMYLNGAAQTISSTSGGQSRPATGANPDQRIFHIGRDGTSTNGFFLSATLDELTVSNVGRGADWIKLSYETQKTGATAVAVSGVTGVAREPSGRPFSIVRVNASGVIFRLPAGSSSAGISVLDVWGREIWRGGTGKSGEVIWDRTSGGRSVPPGVYLVRMTAASGKVRQVHEAKIALSP